MALLTAEDVLNKAFSKTKYREGFDQDEVDDFLDEVAQAISALTAERDDLAQRLAQAQAGQATAPAPVAPSAEEAAPQSESLLQAATDPTPPTATGMLAMAQRLHDEYVSAGEAERDRLIDDAKVKAESIVGQAETDAKSRLDELSSERTELEGKIDDLRRFERDYRSRLKGYLENLLGDLDHGSSNQEPGAASLDDAPAPDRVSFGASFGATEESVSEEASDSVVSAPSVAQASAEDEPAADAAEGEQPAASPWAQVRPESSSSAGEAEESTTPWGASQYTPRVQPPAGEDNQHN
ncbi:DivIVA domain-containing protein [Demequina flava]|uniref:DivIVA domain-containing protein n=1 Tax=Demequina flava TaxID=1095025 RepID=UPI00078563E5|nr:DivIVA domain-containing protein [Demequina flava]